MLKFVKGRARIRQAKPFKKWKLIVIVVAFALVLLLPIIMHISTRVSQNMMTFAKAEVRKVVLQVIGNSVVDAISENPDINNEFFNVRTNDVGEIEMLEYDAVQLNKLLNTTARRIRVNLKAVETGTIDQLTEEENALGSYNDENIRGGVVYEVPVGNALGTPLLANLGPRVPVRLRMVGSVYCFARTSIEEYGINNVMVRIFMYIEVRHQVQLPMMNDEILVRSIELVSIKMVQGRIPDYYGGGGGGSVSIPMVER